jgi:penicillin-binding protein 1A
MKFIFKKLYFITTILIFITLLILSIVGIITFNNYNAFITLKQGHNPIKIYDNNNNIVATDSIYYEYESINNISDNIIKAFVAIEDKDFYKHSGISTKRILKALYNNTFNNTFHGASTITQQYVKNAHLTSEQTIKRKLNEMSIALIIERKYTKDQIMEAYLNTILFGSNIYGVKMASKFYFNKEPKDININEAAYLAGMIKAPNRYNAYTDIKLSDERKNKVLYEMKELNFISENDYNFYNKISIDTHLSKGFINKPSMYLNSYLDYIYSSIDDNHPKEIYTYLDTNIQKELYNIVTDNYNLFLDDKLNCSIIVIDNETYGVKAIMGNRNQNRGVLNYAHKIKLQPGSTIKPILDYAPAFEYLSITPATIIKDEYFTYKDGTPIRNYDNRYLGNITIREALKDSRNVPAVKLYNMVGATRAFNFANKLGITSDNINEADSIGGATYGYTLLDLANAYTAFANLGYYKKASPFKKIVYENYTMTNDEKKNLVMKPSTAYLINTILHDIFKNSNYDLKNSYLMAKTGQTNYDQATKIKYKLPNDATKDSLLIAYTKDITIGIWIGYETIDMNQYIDINKKHIPRNIMRILMNKFAKENNYYDLIDDVTLKYITIYNNNAYLAKSNGYYEYFEQGTEPLTYIDQHITA